MAMVGPGMVVVDSAAHGRMADRVAVVHMVMGNHMTMVGHVVTLGCDVG